MTLRSSPRRASGSVSLALRVRIWVGCLTGAAIATAGLIWVVWTMAPFDGSVDPLLLAVFPWAVGGVGILSGVALALWLDHNIVGRLRGLAHALESEQVEDLRTAGRWGEISELTEGAQRLLARVEHSGRETREARAERERIAGVLEGVLATLGRWAIESDEPLPPAEGPLAPLAEPFGLRAGRARDRSEHARDAVLGVRDGVGRGLEDARETESHAERAFLEATALLATVRELQRLRGELEGALSAIAGRDEQPRREAIERHRAAAAAVIQELVTASTESVERLAAGLTHVQEIADQVHTLANRATLVALDAALAGQRGVTPPEARAASLRALAAEVQAVTARTGELSRMVDREVAAASERMRGLRDRVAEHFERESRTATPGPEARAAGGPGFELAGRLLERLRETVQDAMEKGEGLSAAGERASTAARRLARRLEDEIPAIESLIDQLAGISVPAPSAAPGRPGALRLLRAEDLAVDEPPATGAEEIS